MIQIITINKALCYSITPLIIEGGTYLKTIG